MKISIGIIIGLIAGFIITIVLFQDEYRGDGNYIAWSLGKSYCFNGECVTDYSKDCLVWYFGTGESSWKGKKLFCFDSNYIKGK